VRHDAQRPRTLGDRPTVGRERRHAYELRSSGGQAQSAGIDRYWLQGLLHGRKPRRCTIRAAGELDLAAVDQLRAVLNQQCESGPCLLRLDLSA